MNQVGEKEEPSWIKQDAGQVWPPEALAMLLGAMGHPLGISVPARA